MSEPVKTEENNDSQSTARTKRPRSGAEIRDQLTRQMCRETDAATGPISWSIHALVLVVALLGGWWTMAGIRELREVSQRNEIELAEFRKFAERASRSPKRDMHRVASELSRQISAQSWYSGMEGVRPRVLKTPAGLRVRFARVLPGLERREIR